MFEGQCASEVLQSAISVEEGNGVPHNSQDTRDTDELEIMEAPGTCQVGTRPSPLKKAMGSIVQTECICTNAHSTSNKQEELEAILCI